MTLPSSAQRVVDAAAALGLTIDVQAFPEGTRTAADAAAAVGCEVAQIVKSLVFVAGSTPVLALVSGPRRLDEDALAALAGLGPVRRATADEVRAATSFAVGGVPPFGHTTALPTWVDRTLLDLPVVWAAAGTPQHVFSVSPAELLSVTGATAADVTV